MKRCSIVASGKCMEGRQGMADIETNRSCDIVYAITFQIFFLGKGTCEVNVHMKKFMLPNKITRTSVSEALTNIVELGVDLLM